ncbi:MAG TPA: hypothetical protein P5081_04895 [Phycisphaerae bacterium]|nr:hypothetical protein [Phycisphaerae bacterium]HRW52201.1 hypothetical protein [Phycisphaerae bacterium]
MSIGAIVHAGRIRRRAILLICKSLLDEGESAEEIAKLIYWRSDRIGWVADGELNSEQFIARATIDAKSIGKKFNARRWFCDDEELVHANGRTYALSSQWGKSTEDAIKVLAERYSEHRIRVTPTRANGE